MTTRKLIILAVIFIILLGIATTRQRSNNALHRKTGANKTLLKGVDINDLTEITITQGTGQTVLVKENEQWKVKTLFNYPINPEPFFTMLRELPKVKLGVPMRSEGTISPFEYGLEGRLRVIEFKIGQKVVASIDVGRQREQTPGANTSKELCYIRIDGEDTVYLVDYNFQQISEISRTWTQREVLSVQPTNFVAIITSNFELKKEGDEWILIGATEEEAGKLQQRQVERVSNAFINLMFSNVINPDFPEEKCGFDAGGSIFYTAKTSDGKTYTAKLGGQTQNGMLMKLEGDISEQASGWIYELGNDDLYRFTFPRDELFVPLPERKEGEGNMGMGGLFQQFQK